ncbi:MAG: BON domain-containing protein [Geminicoccaceae bacterium]
MAEEGLARGEDRHDDQLAKAINDRLLSDGDLDGRAIQVHVSAAEATLTGDVDSQEMRDRAEAVAAGVDGIEYVINNLRVAQEGTTGATG